MVLKVPPSRLSTVPNRLGYADGSHEKERNNRNAWRRWYGTKRWKKLRVKILVRDGYVCQQTGEALVGKYPAPNSPVVDHIVKHNGDPDLFWDESNLQSITKLHHDRDKQSQEKSFV